MLDRVLRPLLIRLINPKSIVDDPGSSSCCAKARGQRTNLLSPRSAPLNVEMNQAEGLADSRLISPSPLHIDFNPARRLADTQRFDIADLNVRKYALKLCDFLCNFAGKP